MLAAVLGGLGGGAGAAVGDATSGMGKGLSSFLSGATSGAVRSLNDPQHMLESALTSGVGRGLGGLFNEDVNPSDKKTIDANKALGNNAANLAKLFIKRK